MMKNTDISAFRREYLLRELDETKVNKNPFKQFAGWMKEAVNSGIMDPSAMILATSTSKGMPSVRTVLLKGVEPDGFVFYTNYESRKARELKENPNAAILFLWRELERQIRISGKVNKIPKEQSAEYFHSRPYESQLGALASEQSSVIPDRKYLDEKFVEMKEKYKGKKIPLPEFWGGYSRRAITLPLFPWLGQAHVSEICSIILAGLK